MSAKFTENFEDIILKFNETISQAVSYTNCKNVFHENSTLPLFGANPTCEILTFSSLRVMPGASATIMDGGIIEMNSNHFAPVTKVLEIEPASVKKSPSFNMFGPGVDQCMCLLKEFDVDSGLFFNIDATKHQVYKLLANVTWSVRLEDAPIPPTTTTTTTSTPTTTTTSTPTTSSTTSTSTTTTTTSTTTTTTSTTTSTTTGSSSTGSTASTTTPEPTTTTSTTTTTTLAPWDFSDIFHHQQGDLEMKIPLSKFSREYLYFLKVEGKNVFGNTHNVEKEISFLYNCQPIVMLKRVVSKDVWFEAIVEYPFCWKEKRVPKFTWSITKDSDPSVIVISSTGTTESIYITKRKFDHNAAYTVKLTVNLKNYVGDEITIEKTEGFSVTSEPLQCHISGEEISVGLDKTLALDAGNSFDPEKTAENETFTWQCLDDSNSNCQMNGTDLIIEDNKFVEVNMKNGSFSPTKRYALKNNVEAYYFHYTFT